MIWKYYHNVEKMKSFSKQLKECIKSGNAFEEECVLSKELKHIMCKKYGGQCMSNKCKKERSNK
jgi:hypothetical protein